MPQPRVRVLNPEQMSIYHDPAYLLRPINTGVVEQYKQHIDDGVVFPPIICGTYPDEAGQEAHIMVDGNHTFRACKLAEKPWKCELVTYASLADALADQLRRNAHHGLRITNAQRDRRIKVLIQDHNWSVRQVAQACGVSTATVSRVNRNLQGGDAATRRPSTRDAGPRPLAPRAFIRVIESLYHTLENQVTRAQVLAEVYNPNREPGDIQRIVQHLRQVAEDLSQMVSPQTPRTPASGRRAEQQIAA